MGGGDMLKRTVVCLCGSTRFSEAYQKANIDETLAGRIVLTIGCDLHTDAALFAHYSSEALLAVKRRLDALHFDKIRLADEVLVLNVGGYLGLSTVQEVLFAVSLGKRLRWLEPLADDFLKGGS
jgi:hypothetical protein